MPYPAGRLRTLKGSGNAVPCGQASHSEAPPKHPMPSEARRFANPPFSPFPQPFVIPAQAGI
ncbi:TPA: hypothetical protein ACFRHE_001727 [Neisseria lactamica]